MGCLIIYVVLGRTEDCDCCFLPAVVALAPIAAERVVQRLAQARFLLPGLPFGLAAARVAEIVGIWVQPQESDQAVQLTHTVLHKNFHKFRFQCTALQEGVHMTVGLVLNLKVALANGEIIGF